MNIKKTVIAFSISCMFFSHQRIVSRSIYRPIDTHTPYIEVRTSNPEFTKRWIKAHPKKSYILRSDYLQLTPIFSTYDPDVFDMFLLPNKAFISFRQDANIHVSSQKLSKLAEGVLEEIRLNKQELTNFIILKKRDFNFKTKSGLLVLKYKKYPFVLKLLIEHPHTFVEPFSKSYESGCMFVIGGNLRHLSGFTRIPNLHYTRDLLYQDKIYRDLLDFPRKWFWKPKENAYLEVEWNHIRNKQNFKTSIPCIYGVISDFIIPHPEQPTKALKRISIELSNHLNFLLDPHEGNAMRELGRKKIVIIDTEHFPTMLDLKSKMYAKNYVNWLMQLAFKYIKTKFTRNKEERSRCYDERYYDKSLSINSIFLANK
jgi:hypothetical protein